MYRAITKGYFWDYVNLIPDINYPVTNQTSADPLDVYKLYPIHLLIHHTSHGLLLNNSFTKATNEPTISGDTILIANAIVYMGIPAALINGEFEVYATPIDFGYPYVDYYMIRLQPFDIGTYKTRNDSGGGIFNTYTPVKYRYYFNTNDTLGNLLGFANVGDTASFTKYGTVVTNKMDYATTQITTDNTPGNSIVLSGNNYLLMVCNEIPVINAYGSIKNAFAKILLSGLPGKVLYNTFVDTPKIYYDPLPDLSTLTFSFYTPDGNLYDFNGLDHSFTLEITTLDETPTGTSISARTGKIV